MRIKQPGPPGNALCPPGATPHSIPGSRGRRLTLKSTTEGADLGKLTFVGRKRYYAQLRIALGFQNWPQDVLRHTAASFWLVEVRDAGRVAFELGDSPGILGRHYQEIVTAEDAAKFWALRP